MFNALTNESNMVSQTQFLRQPAVLKGGGISRTSLYYAIKAGLFPKGVQLGPKAVGWPASEVAAMAAATMAGKTPDELRALVVDLQAARAARADAVIRAALSVEAV